MVTKVLEATEELPAWTVLPAEMVLLVALADEVLTVNPVQLDPPVRKVPLGPEAPPVNVDVSDPMVLMAKMAAPVKTVKLEPLVTPVSQVALELPDLKALAVLKVTPVSQAKLLSERKVPEVSQVLTANAVPLVPQEIMVFLVLTVFKAALVLVT